MRDEEKDQLFLPLCIFFGVIAMLIVELIKWVIS